ncbi:YdcF family protein [Shewanella waksmanii]|uniref:YdcF family protein n=1 Tax=Shewanella waksmanii TaxID=213783 RepID=UPI0005643FE3|nr:ElyC/SanA/YdcF family protein [Shewanella waksmanii]
MPIPFTLLMLVLALIFWHRSRLAKCFVVVATTWLLLLSSQFGSYYLVNQLEQQYPVNNSVMPEGCVIAVLGNSHNTTHSDVALQQLSATALSRLIEGLRQASISQHCQFIFSGWNGGVVGPSHAEIQAQAAIALGVKKSNMTLFPLARDTIEEAQYIKQQIGSSPFKLVTSATHMPRAMATFEAMGLSPLAAPTDFISSDDSWWHISIANLSASQRAIHEYLGLLWLRIKHSLSNS